jgi:predicted dehydrogenase
METIVVEGRRPPELSPSLPRLGFVGTGWIGRHRMEAIVSSGTGRVAGVCDSSEEAASAARAVAGECVREGTLGGLLDLGLDGLVIATPNAMHAAQAIAALERGIAVFCQKPLGRDAAETSRVVDAARAADRLLAVDLSYRHTAGMKAIRSLIRSGELGDVYAVEVVFHNAYGPDKPWFYDRSLSGGGCLIDLGTHLVDLALWTLGFPPVHATNGALYSGGRRLEPGSVEVEDFATATLELEGGATVRLACSWNLPAGKDAVIEAAFHGTRGGAAMRNANGSFYDFVAERLRGTAAESLTEPPDAWGDGAIVEWATRLASGEGFDPGIERAVDVARVLDALYGR